MQILLIDTFLGGGNRKNLLTQSRVSVRRWLDVLRHRHSVPDGATGGGAQPSRAGRDPPLVHYEAAERLPRAPQQTCRYVLLLLGGSHT